MAVACAPMAVAERRLVVVKWWWFESMHELTCLGRDSDVGTTYHNPHTPVVGQFMHPQSSPLSGSVSWDRPDVERLLLPP